MTAKPTDRLTAAIDEATGCVVLYDAQGDIRLIVPDGKMQIVRRGEECPECRTENLKFAKRVANFVNVKHNLAAACRRGAK